MRSTTGVHRGDLVLVSQRGRIFHAKVTGVGAGGALLVEPLDRRVRARSVKAAEVIDHWAHSRDPDRGPSLAQLAFDDLSTS